jgi:hypothetical protein
MQATNRLDNVRRRVNRARRGTPEICVTCAASRHVHLMADALASGRAYPMLQEEPEHCAGSLLSVLESLWKARRRLAELEARR